MQLDLLRKRAEKIGVSRMRSPNVLNNEFRFISGMNFTCNGTLTSLLLGVDVRTVTDSRNQYPEVQTWRKNQTDSPYNYSMQDRREIRLAAGDFSPDGVLVYNLAPPMQFQSGDVLGVSQPRGMNSVVRLYYDVSDSAPDAIQIRNNNPSSFAIVSNQYILLSPVTGRATFFSLT